MKTYLVFPDRDSATLSGYKRRRTPITWTTDPPSSDVGLGVLLDESGEVFDWLQLAVLHHQTGAYLETSDHAKVERALGLLTDETDDLSDYIRPLKQSGSALRGAFRPKRPVRHNVPIRP